MRAVELLDLEQLQIGRHDGLNEEDRGAATIEDRAQAAMENLRGLMRRERERSRTPGR